MTGGGEEEGADGRPGRLPQTLHKETRLRPLINSFDGPGGTKGEGSRQQQGGGLQVGHGDRKAGKTQ